MAEIFSVGKFRDYVSCQDCRYNGIGKDYPRNIFQLNSNLLLVQCFDKWQLFDIKKLTEVKHIHSEKEDLYYPLNLKVFKNQFLIAINCHEVVAQIVVMMIHDDYLEVIFKRRPIRGRVFVNLLLGFPTSNSFAFFEQNEGGSDKSSVMEIYEIAIKDKSFYHQKCQSQNDDVNYKSLKLLKKRNYCLYEQHGPLFASFFAIGKLKVRNESFRIKTIKVITLTQPYNIPTIRNGKEEEALLHFQIDNNDSLNPTTTAFNLKKRIFKNFQDSPAHHDYSHFIYKQFKGSNKLSSPFMICQLDKDCNSLYLLNLSNFEKIEIIEYRDYILDPCFTLVNYTIDEERISKSLLESMEHQGEATSEETTDEVQRTGHLGIKQGRQDVITATKEALYRYRLDLNLLHNSQ